MRIIYRFQPGTEQEPILYIIPMGKIAFIWVSKFPFYPRFQRIGPIIPPWNHTAKVNAKLYPSVMRKMEWEETTRRESR